jgi:hypothetical protein
VIFHRHGPPHHFAVVAHNNLWGKNGGVILNPWLGINMTRHIFDSQKLTKKFCARTLFDSLFFRFASLYFRFASLYSILKKKFALFASLRFFVRFASLRFLGE